MNWQMTQSKSTWAEDTALQRCTRSAVPGAKTEARPAATRAAVRDLSLRDWPPRVKPSRHDAAKSPTGRPLSLTNANRLKFQLPGNQDSSTFARCHRASPLRGASHLGYMRG